MFLRSLTLRGFKSFAEKTTLEFAPGISVIVGPNGSGKSNLVDAISWALGEQGPRAMRGGQMSDVIFAGSPGRAALGMAEVHLVIDNAAGKIPVPMSELEISRTIFRSGDSEYRTGGQLCRLLDIQELLSDSGIGRALHTVVGQGQLEDVLTARPEERRQYIEEAAGIAKHRRRKERAQRKLASLEQDLLRLQDVLAELKRQVKPLKQQAEVAARHEQLSGEADEVAWRLAAARLRGLLARSDSQRPVWEEGMSLRRDGKQRLETLDSRIAELSEQRERAAAARAQAEEELQRAQEAKAAAEMELREADREESAARARVEAGAARGVRLSSLADEISTCETARGELARQLADHELELEEAEREFREAERARMDAEEERRRLLEEAAARRAEVEALRRSIAASDHERSRIRSAVEAVREKIATIEAEGGRLEREIERLDAETTPDSELRDALERERHALGSQVSELEDRAREHTSHRDLLAARVRDMDETPGSRFLEANAGRAIGLLGGLMSAARGFERALSAALGPLADSVVYERQDQAVADARAADGAVLAVAGGDDPSFSLPGERSLLSVVEADPRVKGLACTVLRDVYVADSLEEATAKRRAYPRASFVTTEGTMIGPAFIQTATGDGGRARALYPDLAAAERDAAASAAALKPLEGRLEELAAEAASVTARIETADEAITRAAESLAALGPELAATRKEEEFLSHRLASIDESTGGWRAALGAGELAPTDLPDLPRRPEAPVGARVAVEAARRGIADLEQRISRLRADLSDLSAETPEALRDTVAAAEARRIAAEQTLASTDSAFEEMSALRDSTAAEERQATSAEALANREWREAAADLDRLREAYEEEDRLRGDLDRRIGDAERLLREGFGKDPREAVAALSEDDSVASLEKRSELIQRRLALLGKVNLLASGEFEALQERYDFMYRELEDVRKARRDLLEVVRRVDEDVVALFDSAFRDVAAAFEGLFKELFPGGEGRLVLTDPADLLNTGVEVEARPGRKRVKRISLLSGGERALTALGFLFSIFRARPSPFYLLDEVEAALDDVNLHRFLGLIQGFAQESQVLIVTHQKRTMEIADMLYGVSMGKDGSSRVVCQRLENASPRSSLPAVSEPEPVH